jgi:hypothetical protein
MHRAEGKGAMASTETRAEDTRYGEKDEVAFECGRRAQGRGAGSRGSAAACLSQSTCFFLRPHLRFHPPTFLPSPCLLAGVSHKRCSQAIVVSSVSFLYFFATLLGFLETPCRKRLPSLTGTLLSARFLMVRWSDRSLSPCLASMRGTSNRDVPRDRAEGV